MRRRAAALDGELHLQASAEGTTITLGMPKDGAQAA
jgi:signal transduction histidine kinase